MSTNLVAGAIEGILSAGGDLVGKFYTSDKDKIMLQLQEKELDQRIDLAQIKVNEESAKSGSLFVAGGRPAVIWIGAIALGLAIIPKVLFLSLMWLYLAFRVVINWNGVGDIPQLPVFPPLGTEDIIALLGSLLGLSGLRSYDKTNGSATTRLEK